MRRSRASICRTRCCAGPASGSRATGRRTWRPISRACRLPTRRSTASRAATCWSTCPTASQGLRELARVLRTGGRMLLLDDRGQFLRRVDEPLLVLPHVQSPGADGAVRIARPALEEGAVVHARCTRRSAPAESAWRLRRCSPGTAESAANVAVHLLSQTTTPCPLFAQHQHRDFRRAVPAERREAGGAAADVEHRVAAREQSPAA